MDVGEMVFVAWMVLSSLVVFALGPLAVALGRAIRPLDRVQPTPPETWPALSVIVPACNEEETIAEALKTLCAQDYPGLEIIVVNDRSTDGTGEVIDRLAAEEPRLVVIHVEHLPEGWLGKVHALKVGSDEASGDLVLFTDADVHFEDDALRRAVALAEQDQLDHLAILPKFVAPTFWLRTLIISFGAGFFMTVRPHSIGKPGSGSYIGVGAFNLVRSAFFCVKNGGIHWRRTFYPLDALRKGQRLGL